MTTRLRRDLVLTGFVCVNGVAMLSDLSKSKTAYSSPVVLFTPLFCHLFLPKKDRARNCLLALPLVLGLLIIPLDGNIQYIEIGERRYKT